MALLNNNFIDYNYYTSTNNFNTGFKAEFDNLSPQNQARFMELASTRVRRLINRPFVDLNDFELEQQEGIKNATCRILDYWMEYGFDLNRVSGSVSLGAFSASQTAPNDPDYIPEMVYEVLMAVNLYTPVGYVGYDDIYHTDEEQAVTYGVRYRTLERVKDINLVKGTKETNNLSLAVPTETRVNELIQDRINSPIVTLGSITLGTNTNNPLIVSVNSLPTSTEINAQYNDAAGLTLDSGAKVGAAIVGSEANDYDAITFIDANGALEQAIFVNGLWTIDNALTQQGQIFSNTVAKVNTLTGITPSRAITATEGDQRYIRTDGLNTMNSGYSSSGKPLAPTVRQELDSVDSRLTTAVSTLNDQILVVGETILDNTYRKDETYTRAETDALFVPVNDSIDTQKGRIDVIDTNLNDPVTGLNKVVSDLQNASTNANYVTTILKYSSDIGQAQQAGGTSVKATFDLAHLQNDNSCSLPGADPAKCNPSFLFNDESIFTIKVRFTIDGQTAPAGNKNLLFTINTGDAEPTIIAIGDRNGSSANQGVILKAQLSTAGILVMEAQNVDGTTPSFSIINFNVMTVNQIEQMVYTPATSIVTQTNLADTNNKVAANTAAIALKASQADHDTLAARVTATESVANGAKGYTDSQINLISTTYQPLNSIGLTTTNDSIVGAINEVNAGKNTNTTDITSLKGKSVRTIDASGVEIGMSLSAYTTSALDNGLIDKSVLDKRTTIDIATKAEVNTKAPQATTYTKAEVDAGLAAKQNTLTLSDATVTFDDSTTAVYKWVK